MKRNSIARIISIILIFLTAVLFVIKFGGPSILRMYIEMGIGNCKKIPILCMSPKEEIINAEVDRVYARHLVQYNFPKMSISVPKGFAVVQEQLKKVYYKKRKANQQESVVYIDQQGKDFLINLFPKIRKQGVKNDFELMRLTMHAKINTIKNLNDAFFVILKSIFTPDLGDQNEVQMLEVSIGNKKCFVNYNVTGPENYFDFNAYDDKGFFFKVYIRDKNADLDLSKALTIISTAVKTSP